MAEFWNRIELANPPRHIEKKRKEAVYEWIPCAGSKRKLDLTGEERILDEEMKPSAKLFAVDETVQEYVLDSDGYMRGNYTENTTVSPATIVSAPAMDLTEQLPNLDVNSAEIESMAMDENEELPESGLRECMVVNDKKGGGNSHGLMGNSIGDGTVTYTSLVLSNEVRYSMAKRPVDFSTVLAQEMVKQATMAVVLWKPLLPSPKPLTSVAPHTSSQNPVSPNSSTPPSNTMTNIVNKESKLKNSNEEEMETTEEN